MRTKCWMWLASAVLSAVSTAAQLPEYPNAVYVAPEGGDTPPYASWASASRSIQAAIETAPAGSVILVGPGTYRERLKFAGRDISVMSLYEATGDERYIHETVLDGERGGCAVTFGNAETPACVLSGFTVTNGFNADHGGGISARKASPTLRHLVVTGCETKGEGAGIYMEHSGAVLRDLVVRGNTAHQGSGGIRVSYGLPSVSEVVVDGNRSDGAGCGMLVYHSDCTLKNCLFVNNQATGEGGGGLFFDGANVRIQNCTIASNEAVTGVGGGINVSYSSHPHLVNCVVKGNRPEQISFNTRWYNMAITIENSFIEGGVAGIPTYGKGPVHALAGSILSDPAIAELGFYTPVETSAMGAQARPLSMADGAAGVDQPPAPTAGAAMAGTLVVEQTQAAYSILRVGFSSDPEGDQDVTEFYPDETLYARVDDVDIPASSTNAWFLIVLRQPADAGEVRETLRLTPRDNGSFFGAVPLARFHAGPVSIAVIGRTGHVSVIRESSIHVHAR